MLDLKKEAKMLVKVTRPYSHPDKVSAGSALYYSLQFVMEPKVSPAKVILMGTPVGH